MLLRSLCKTHFRSSRLLLCCRRCRRWCSFYLSITFLVFFLCWRQIMTRDLQNAQVCRIRSNESSTFTANRRAAEFVTNKNRSEKIHALAWHTINIVFKIRNFGERYMVAKIHWTNNCSELVNSRWISVNVLGHIQLLNRRCRHVEDSRKFYQLWCNSSIDNEPLELHVIHFLLFASHVCIPSKR